MAKLCIVFSVGAQRFAIPCARVIEVAPGVKLLRRALEPARVAGAFTFRGVVTDVIDLACLLGAPPAELRLSTRIIVVSSGSRAAPLGLLTERVSGTVRLELPGDAASRNTGSAISATLLHEGELIDLLDLDLLLPELACEGRPAALEGSA